nr:GNAT family N-acetyltransferase [Microvirga solisilvae]
MWRGALAKPDPQAKLVVAVQADGEIVGFARGGPIRNKGADLLATDAEIFAIYLLDKAKRQGLGRRMMIAVFDHLAAQGFGSVGLWVLKENLAARRFYEMLGGRAGREQSFDVRGQMLTEVAYRFAPIPKI